jgi:hypothetical protein
VDVLVERTSRPVLLAKMDDAREHQMACCDSTCPKGTDLKIYSQTV